MAAWWVEGYGAGHRGEGIKEYKLAIAVKTEAQRLEGLLALSLENCKLSSYKSVKNSQPHKQTRVTDLHIETAESG